MSDQFNRGFVLSRLGTDAQIDEGLRASKLPQIDEGLRAYMVRVYNYMATGLAVTGAVAFTVASTPAVFDAIFDSYVVWIVILAPLVMGIYFISQINKMDAVSAQASYWFFAVLMGLSLASIFVIYAGESIARVFFITAATFAAMSLYGYTRRDLTAWYSFLFMGLIGIIIVMAVNNFIGSTELQLVVSVLGVLIFTGLTAYDTQKIKEMYVAADGSEVVEKKAIIGALQLYLNFLNLFLLLLYLVGNSE